MERANAFIKARRSGVDLAKQIATPPSASSSFIVVIVIIVIIIDLASSCKVELYNTGERLLAIGPS